MLRPGRSSKVATTASESHSLEVIDKRRPKVQKEPPRGFPYAGAGSQVEYGKRTDATNGRSSEGHKHGDDIIAAGVLPS